MSNDETALGTSTSYLGFRLSHPFIAGASPFGHSLDGIKRLEDAGCAAVVLHSLFEEQITLAEEGRISQMDPFDSNFQETLARYPAPSEYPFSPDAYAAHIFNVKKAVRIPVIASLNGSSSESWLRFALAIQQAGADALELNPYEVVTDLDTSGAAIERRLVDTVRELKGQLTIPLAIKLSPFYTALADVSHQLDEAGANALVLFNRFYQPDIDIKTSTPMLRLELSTSSELLLRLRWLAILHGRVRASLAASGGVSTPRDGIKAILAGADVVQLVSALLRHGPTHIASMRRGLEEWMEWNKLPTLEGMRGTASLMTTRDPAAFERANYIRTLQSWNH